MFQKHLFLAEELTNFVLESLFFDVEQTFHDEETTFTGTFLPFSRLFSLLFKALKSDFGS
jgi:hypothetical protein